MSKNRHTKQKHYVRLSLVERKETQESLNKRAICLQIRFSASALAHMMK